MGGGGTAALCFLRKIKTRQTLVCQARQLCCSVTDEKAGIERLRNLSKLLAIISGRALSQR